MIINRNSAIAEKRDLHVGGLGATSSAGLATMVEPLADASEHWVGKARDVIRLADDAIRDRPWAAIGVIAFVGLAAGYLLSRRS